MPEKEIGYQRKPSLKAANLGAHICGEHGKNRQFQALAYPLLEHQQFTHFQPCKDCFRAGKFTPSGDRKVN
eukprot:1154739-Pelagomonas_calceolata.AAC.1